MNYTSEQSFDPSKNFGLSYDDFNEKRKKLLSGDETLFEIIYKSHFEKCRSFLVRKMGAESSQAYDITLETLLKFRRNLLNGKLNYGNLAALFTIDARNTWLRMQRREQKNEHILLDDEEMDRADDEATDPFEVSRIDQLKSALQKVGSDCYELLNWHYYLKIPFRAIADSRLQRGDEKFINESSVKTKLAECRKKLKTLLT